MSGLYGEAFNGDFPDDELTVTRGDLLDLIAAHDKFRARVRELEAVPRVDLDTDSLRHPRYAGEWHYGPSKPGPWGGVPQVVGYADPGDGDGYVAVLRSSGVARDDLPGLIAFLSHIYVASDPTNRTETAEEVA